jgi:hypothetical protein
MSLSTGVACLCNKCGSTPQWYENGACRRCGSAKDFVFTWVANSATGGVPSAAPSDTFALQQGASAQLVDSWTNLVLVRGLTPVRTSPGPGPAQFTSPGWYRQRGVKCSVQFAEPPTDPRFGEKFNQACDWTNQTFVVRTLFTFEAFASGKKPKESRLPNTLGMREFHHARRLRNAIAHGNPLSDPTLVTEETQLFRPGTTPASTCSMAIDAVLEPLWARLLIYAASLEHGAAPLPDDPAVVVTSMGKTLYFQSLHGACEGTYRRSRTSLSIGDIVSLKDIVTD